MAAILLGGQEFFGELAEPFLGQCHVAVSIGSVDAFDALKTVAKTRSKRSRWRSSFTSAGAGKEVEILDIL